MTVNEAIFTVLVTKYKKEAPEAFKIVESLPNIRVYKNNGSFDIRNKGNDRWITGIQERYSYIKGGYYCYIGIWGKEIDVKDAMKVDFISYLTCKRKKYYEESEKKSQALCKYETLRFHKDMVKRADAEYKRAKQRINDLMDSLEILSKDKVRREEELEAYRKRFGLKGRR